MMLLEPVLSLVKGVLEKVIPDANLRKEAEMKLAQAALEGELKPLELRLSAILAEARSGDPWTSRARPSFLYVIYLMILWAIPMGILTVFDPAAAGALTRGATGWLHAIPEELYTLFGVGYLGYAAGRTLDKRGKGER